MKSKITVSGNIISELSEKIPSNIIALNELIKNSYDAGADSVDIILDTTNQELIIKDDGEGMDKSDIDTLFHVSKSHKVYGKLNPKYNRYTQGSKGLGFLAVFKFGNEVIWETKKDEGYRFSVNYTQLLNENNISDYIIDLQEDDRIEKGTKITINLDDYNIKSLNNYFQEEKNYKKIIDAFDDKNFNIRLKVNQNTYSSEHMKLLEIAPDYRLYHVKYSSTNQLIKFNYNGYDIIKENYPFLSSRYGLELELVIFYLKSGTKSKINKLYYNPNNDLTPLIYFNKNLFHNYDMFNPNIMRNIKSGLSLNQMIGKINIISHDKEINFNSDRTQLLQNELTDEIKIFLQEINQKIQKLGSKAKKYLINYDFITQKELPEECMNYSDAEEFRKFICDDFMFRNEVEIVHNGMQVTFSIFGKSITKCIRQSSKEEDDCKDTNGTSATTPDNKKSQKFLPAEIVLKVNKEKIISLPSEKQIDLYTYIDHVKNSVGEPVEHSLVNIQVDGKNSNNILPSIIEEKQINVTYSYNDKNTGVVIKELKLIFKNPTNNFSNGNDKIDLISLPIREDYKLEYNDNINKLINGINKLDRHDYDVVIACCLRSIFEMSIDSIAKNSKFPNFFKTNKLEEKVEQAICHIKNNKAFCTAISKTTLIDYNSLCNLLDPASFKDVVKKSNLGAHKADLYMTSYDIETLGKFAAYFVVITNEMINNDQITK